MEAYLKTQLSLSTVKKFGSGGKGCISSGQGYETEDGKIFVKFNDGDGATGMFEGEEASLAAIVATNTIRAPKPMKVLDNPSGTGAMLVTEYFDMRGLHKYARQLGHDLAMMHRHNEDVARMALKQSGSVHNKGAQPDYVDKFGFHIPTCCGRIPQDNTWEEDWAIFLVRHKFQQQLDLVEKDYSDREARELWQQLMPKVPGFFKGLDIKPALLHGDLWSGNAGEVEDMPVIFDPASFYGHSEYDLGIAMMFGGFGEDFFNSYFEVCPKTPGFSTRNKLYQLFHYLNHWTHFGGGYKASSIGIMKELISIAK